MYPISGFQHYSLSSMSNAYHVNHIFPINNISNSYDAGIKPMSVDLSLKQASYEADDVHHMAYSAYVSRTKRAEVAHQYSDADCQKASAELSNLLNVVVYHPPSWQQMKNRIESLQHVVKSADCKKIK